jgi:hypothetical protein
MSVLALRVRAERSAKTTKNALGRTTANRAGIVLTRYASSKNVCLSTQSAAGNLVGKTLA